MVGRQIGDERTILRAVAVGEEEDALVPDAGAGESELGAVDFAGFDQGHGCGGTEGHQRDGSNVGNRA